MPPIRDRKSVPRAPYTTRRTGSGSASASRVSGQGSIERSQRNVSREGSRGGRVQGVQGTGRPVAGRGVQGSVGVGRSVGGQNANAGVGARANGGASAQAGRRGVSADARGDVFVGAEGRVRGRRGAASAEGNVRAGAMASGRAGGSVTRRGAAVNLEGDAFAGARAGVNGRLAGRRGSVGAGVEGYAGAGVTGRIGASVGADRIGVRFKVGAALGLGGAISGEVSVNPRQVVRDAGRLLGGIGRRIRP